MELALPYVTLTDPTLTHQVQLHQHGSITYVSCNCRARTGKHSKAGKTYYDPIAPTKNIDESRRLYNDPINHWAPFTYSDRAKW